MIVRLHNLLLILILLCASSTGLGGDVKQPPYMGVKFTNLFDRTYSRMNRTFASHAPGPLLYPEYTDFQGFFYFHGPKWFIEQVSEHFDGCETGADFEEGVFRVRLQRQVGKERKSVPFPLDEMQFGPEYSADESHYARDFRVPVTLGETWKEGRYFLSSGISYEVDGARKSVGTGQVYFEIRKVKKGSADEINLLTNAWSRSPNLGVPGLLEKLALKDGLMPLEVPRRILEIDPHDAWARFMLLDYYRDYNIEFRKCAELYKQVQKDIEAGQAHRLIAFYKPWNRRCSSGRRRRSNEELAEGMRLASENSEGIMLDQYNKRKQKVIDVLEGEGKDALIDIFETPADESLHDQGVPPQVILAIRIAGERGIKAAEPVLIQELKKLRPVPGDTQVEICVALSKLRGIEEGKADTRSQMYIWSRGKEIVKSWQSGNAPEPFPPGAEDGQQD